MSAKATLRGVLPLFVDDSVIVSLLSSDDPEHGSVMAGFIDYWVFSNLDVSKTKEMTIYFKNTTDISPVVINDQAIEVVWQYNYLDI